MSSYLLPFLILLCQCVFGISETRGEETVDTLFENGVDAFMEERWDACIANFEGALLSSKKSKVFTLDCHRKCNKEVASSVPLMAENVENLQTSEKIVTQSFCLLGCHSGPDTYSFDTFKSYEYLQHCYFQKNLLQKAASAVYTVLVENPENEAMVSLLEFYATMPGIDLKNIVNLEAHPFVALYRKGLAAYDRKDYPQVIESMERSLKDYLEVEETCRAGCSREEQPLFNWLPEYSSPVISHIASGLKCKLGCPINLTTKDGKRQENLPADHFKYLHFAYFKVGDVSRACEAVSSLQLFHPDDTLMRSIVTHYRSMPNASELFFVPREEAVKYVARESYELQLLDAIDKSARQQEIGYTDWQYNAVQTASEANTKEASRQRKIQRRSLTMRGERNAQDESAAINEIRGELLKNTHLLKTETDLKGPNRFLAGGLASEDECKTLMELAKTAAKHGDGYIRNGNPTPFSKREELQTVSLRRAALMGHFGIVDQSSVDKLFEVSDRVKAFLENHYNLRGKLFHEHANMICRNPFPVIGKEQLPDSHPPHADNCNLHRNGTCVKEAWHRWRDYSAIVYLNDDFEGGEFYFTSNMSESGPAVEVKAHCGHLLGFSSGFENPHAVRGVHSGTRCAFVQLFTLTPTRDDKSRIEAQQARDRTRMMGSLNDAVLARLDEFREFS